MRRLPLTFVAAIAVFVMLVVPALAPAAPATTSRLTFGDPFISSNPNAMPFQTSLLTPDRNNISEATSPVCLAPASAGALAGQLVPSDSLERLRKVLREGELILANDTETIAGRYDGDAERAYRDYINFVRQGKYHDANRVRAGSDYDLGEDKDGTPDPFVNAMLNPQATSTSLVRANVPVGCIFDQQIDNSKDDLGSLFRDPSGFVWRLMVWIGSAPAASTYNWLAPITYRYSFFTPHAERGETMFNVIGSDDRKVQQYGYDPSLKTDAVAATTGSPWLVLAVWLRAALSGFYVLALIVAGFMYMLGDRAKRKLDALKMMPRILLSVILTLAIPTLIGTAITVSNLITQEFFASDPTCVETEVHKGRCQMINQINAVVQQSNQDLSSISNYFDAGVFQLISINGAALFYAFFAAVAILRQLAMIALVVLAPVACFTIIFERHQEWFSRWAKAVVAVCLIPIGMALILRVGLSLNPLAADLATSASTGKIGSSAQSIGERFLSLVIMFCTFYFMMKVPRMLKGWVTGRQGTGFGVQALRGLGGRMAGSGSPALALAGRGMGQAASASDFTNRQMGRLVPGDSHENRALPSSSLRARSLRRVSGSELTPGGVVEATVLGLPSGRSGGPAGGENPASGGRPPVAPGDATAPGASPATGGPATGDVGREDRRPLTQREYQGMIADQAHAAQSERDSGIPARPQEWIAERDNEGNFWAARNPNFHADMAGWRERVRAAAAGGGDVAPDGPADAQTAGGPRPDIGGPAPKLEVAPDLANVSAAAAPPGSVTGPVGDRPDADLAGTGIPLSGHGPSLGGPETLAGVSDPIGDELAGPEPSVFADDAADTEVAPLTRGERPVIEPVSADEIDDLFEPIAVPQADASGRVEAALEGSLRAAEADWEDRRHEILGRWSDGLGSLSERQRGDVQDHFHRFSEEHSGRFAEFSSDMRLPRLAHGDPAGTAAWLDWGRDRLDGLSERDPAMLSEWMDYARENLDGLEPGDPRAIAAWLEWEAGQLEQAEASAPPSLR